MGFFNSFSVTKATTTNSDFSDWRYNLEKFILPSIDGAGGDRQTSVAPILRPYANASSIEDLFEDAASGLIVFLLRKEEKKISASMLKKRIADFEIRNQCKANRVERDEIKSILNSSAQIKVDFAPVIVDTKGEVYVFSASKNLIAEAMDICGTVFNFEYSNDDLAMHSPSFLTWLWWRMENTDGSLANVDGEDIDVTIGESVKCESALGSISSKSVLEEARASLSKGADVVEIETLLIDGDNAHKVVFSSLRGTLKGMSILQDEDHNIMADVALAFLEVKKAFKVRDCLLERFEKEQGLITDELRQNWGLKKFCPMLIGDF